MNDFDGNGIDDLVVGAPGDSPGSGPQSGSAFVFKSLRGRGLNLNSILPDDELEINEEGDLFGSSFAVGNFINDPFDDNELDDLVVGAPGESPGSDPQSGFAFVFNGSNDGLIANKGLGQSELGTNEEGDLFGSSLTVGDFNNDGFDDLVVGAPGESPGSDPQSGFAFVFNGSNDGLIPNTSLGQDGTIRSGRRESNEEGDLFGSSLI